MSQENWRWTTGRHLRPTAATIQVIEPCEKDEDRPDGIPFGFAPAREEREPTDQPLTWEGDQA